MLSKLCILYLAGTHRMLYELCVVSDVLLMSSGSVYLQLSRWAFEDKPLESFLAVLGLETKCVYAINEYRQAYSIYFK